jgi:hypothetical protein
MAKFQIPTVGGIRKVLKTQAQASGTTIAGLENQTITIEQLAALLGVTIPPNTGGGNIGQGDEATLSLGPGLAGGGPLVGNVPVRLTIPMPLIGEDGPPGEDSFVPGPQGQRGPPGPAGPISMYQFDDSSADEALLPMSAPANFGATTVNATLTAQSGPSSTASVIAIGNNVAAQAAVFAFSAITSAYTFRMRGGPAFVSNSGFPLLVLDSIGNGAGMIQNDSANQWSIAYNTASNFGLGAPIFTWTSAGTCTITSTLSIKGATPASATAAQTDLGNTTTGTVITTVGGIALPALASTFWRVNVNGVAYGVPLFAL